MASRGGTCTWPQPSALLLPYHGPSAFVPPSPCRRSLADLLELPSDLRTVFLSVMHTLTTSAAHLCLRVSAASSSRGGKAPAAAQPAPPSIAATAAAAAAQRAPSNPMSRLDLTAGRRQQQQAESSSARPTATPVVAAASSSSGSSGNGRLPAAAAAAAGSTGPSVGPATVEGGTAEVTEVRRSIRARTASWSALSMLAGGSADSSPAGTQHRKVRSCLPAALWCMQEQGAGQQEGGLLVPRPTPLSNPTNVEYIHPVSNNCSSQRRQRVATRSLRPCPRRGTGGLERRALPLLLKPRHPQGTVAGPLCRQLPSVACRTCPALLAEATGVAWHHHRRQRTKSWLPLPLLCRAWRTTW